MPSLQSGCCQFTKQYCHPKIANAIAVAPGVRRFRLRYIYLRVPKRCIVSGMINGSASNYFPYDIHRTHTPSQRTIRKNRFPVRVGVQRDCRLWILVSGEYEFSWKINQRDKEVYGSVNQRSCSLVSTFYC